MTETLDIASHLPLSDYVSIAEGIIRNRILIAAMDFEIGSEEYDKVADVADTVKVTIEASGNHVTLNIDYDTSIAGSAAYLAIDESEKMLDIFFPDWLEDSIDGSIDLVDAAGKYLEQEIYYQLGGGA